MYDFEPILLRIKKAKAQSGLTNEELSKKSGVALGTVNKILSGDTREPKLPAIMALAEALDVSADYLIYGAKDKKETPTPVSEDERNVVRMAGRDGSYVVRRLSDEQYAAFKALLEQLPDADF